MAVYLTCSRTRGQQKKHIDICHRCDARNMCRPYQAHIGDHPAAAGDDTRAGGDTPPAGRVPIKDIIGELREIKFLLSGTGKIEEMDQKKIISASPPAQISIGDLIRELENIKSLYEVSSAGYSSFA